MSAQNQFSLYNRLHVISSSMDLQDEAVWDPALGFDSRQLGDWNYENFWVEGRAPITGTDGLHMSHYPAVNVSPLQCDPSSIGPIPENTAGFPVPSTESIPPFVHHDPLPVPRPLGQAGYPFTEHSMAHSRLLPHRPGHRIAASRNDYAPYSISNNTHAYEPQAVVVPSHASNHDVNVVRMPFGTILHYSKGLRSMQISLLHIIHAQAAKISQSHVSPDTGDVDTLGRRRKKSQNQRNRSLWKGLNRLSSMLTMD
jgi:hypothetical protein